SVSRRKKRSIARYVSFFATPILGKKTSELGRLFIARCLSNRSPVLLFFHQQDENAQFTLW
ncbi:MAG: hypothetical protein Q9M09_03945, partial [Mariprofundaceae bacterium]|nr:hypothetical protein [Mariprofundaceae bacterium]